MFWSLGILSF